jgi:hypothetical protein
LTYRFPEAIRRQDVLEKHTVIAERSFRVSFSVAVALLLGRAAIASAADGRSGSPLGPLPEGWVWLPSEGIDSWMGNFHDKVSGACVHMDAAWPSVVRPLGADGSEVGAANGIRYHRRAGKAKCRGGSSIEVSFFPPNQGPLVWNFDADFCQPPQRERTEELLFQRGHVGTGSPVVERQNGRRPAPDEATGIAIGTPVTAVIEKLGLPADSDCLDSGGFTLGYALSHGQSYREWDLRFDASQGFLSATRRHPGY